MKINLTRRRTVFFVSLFFAFAIIGFMIRLPSGLRHADKELHALFYFIAAAALNILFKGQSIIRHLLIFAGLYLFGVAIEYAQEYSNTFFHKRLHGRFDPADLGWNLRGLIAFSMVWICFLVGRTIRKAKV